MPGFATGFTLMACETQRYRDSTRRVGHTTTRFMLGYGVHCGEKLSLKLEPWCQMFCRGTPCGCPFSEWRAKTFLRISTCQFACFQHTQTNLYQAKLRLAFTQKIKGINTANPKLFTDIWYFHFFCCVAHQAFMGHHHSTCHHGFGD